MDASTIVNDAITIILVVICSFTLGYGYAQERRDREEKRALQGLDDLLEQSYHAARIRRAAAGRTPDTPLFALVEHDMDAAERTRSKVFAGMSNRIR